MLSKKATKYAIPHLQDIHTLMAPGRAFAGLFVQVISDPRLCSNKLNYLTRCFLVPLVIRPSDYYALHCRQSQSLASVADFFSSWRSDNLIKTYDVFASWFAASWFAASPDPNIMKLLSTCRYSQTLLAPRKAITLRVRRSRPRIATSITSPRNSRHPRCRLLAMIDTK
jgi:hypothetical protein